MLVSGVDGWRDGQVLKWGDSQALVAHACNPTYKGDRDQEDHSSKPAPGN
jgi:hypothetical protein